MSKRMHSDEVERFNQLSGLNPDGTAPPLHEDLQPFVVTTTGRTGWPMLNHPLVQIFPFTEEVDAGRANQIYAHKLAAVDRARATGTWWLYLGLHERPYRVNAFGEVSLAMTNHEYWESLAWLWSDTENLWQHGDDWRALLMNPRRRRTRARYFMDDEERARLRALPAKIEVWRGTNASDGLGSGMSWTLDPERATWFARRRRRDDGVARVLHGIVRKSTVIAVILGRNEDEVVVAKPEHVAVDDITEMRS